ncbi:MAG: protein kinase/lanthionine synthetase C family protein [Cytophagales bacterium]|nr:protein kinase/lanthionine synthetase C family protein [Cytophagales bacterium]
MDPNTITPSNGKKTIIENYQQILDDFGLKYRQVDIYCKVGQPEQVQGWILHLSTSWVRFPDLLSAVIPILLEFKVPFKSIQNRGQADMINQGNLGLHLLGKMLTIYPEESVAVPLVQQLLAATTAFTGCDIPTDFHLGGIVYTRYGAFDAKVGLDQTGRMERYIYSPSGQLIKDEYTIPFQLPKEVSWPFGELTEPVAKEASTLLNGSYQVYKTLKDDAKGRVMKALRFKGFKVEWIIIKEAKRGICVDAGQRDVKDRLHHQYVLQRDLEGKVPVPKVYDYFEENGHAYLAMQYIKGRNFAQIIETTYAMSTWLKLDLEKKNVLIDHVLQLLDTISRLHEEGYVHRDVTPVNFILDKRNTFVLIDMELAYSMDTNQPDPPFMLGTPGFISPEQQAVETPEPAHDIYSFGGLMIKVFTNLSPSRFDPTNCLWQQLQFFTGDRKISQLMARCLSSEAAQRPKLDQIKAALSEFKQRLDSIDPTPTVSHQEIKKSIVEAIAGLSLPLMVQEEHVWHSNQARSDEPLANQQVGVGHDFGLYTGVAGVMYAIAKAKKQGYDIEPVQEIYDRSLNFLHTYCLDVLPNVVQGLYHGASGIAVALAMGIKAGLMDAHYRSFVERCLNIYVESPTLAHGIAGQGLAGLRSWEVIGEEGAEPIVVGSKILLLEKQQKDGSWVNSEGVKATGFADGVAGICYFLLEHYRHLGDQQAKEGALQALRWLRKQAKKDKKGIYWPHHPGDKRSDPWFQRGGAGIAFCFLHAYTCFGDPEYKKIAEKALQVYPECMVFHNFTWAHGTIGLARTYQVAYQVFNEPQWKERADYIMNTILNMAWTNNKGVRCWTMELGSNPTADLMVGNAGVLHFLMDSISPPDTYFLE